MLRIMMFQDMKTYLPDDCIKVDRASIRRKQNANVDINLIILPGKFISKIKLFKVNG